MTSRSANHEFKDSRPYTSAKGCPSGYHKRSAYTTKAGTHVPARCVRSTTHHKESSAQFKSRSAAKMTQRLRLHIPSIRSLSRKDCPPGMIPRKAYVRKFTSRVKREGYLVRKASGKVVRVFPKKNTMAVESRCVKDLGLPGKGPRSGKGIGPLHKGELARFGYSFRESESRRHEALKKAAKEYGALGVYRKLDAVAKLTLRTLPAVSKQFAADRDWVKKALGPLKAF